MAFLFRPVSVKPVPPNAVVRTVNGKRVATWTNRKNKKVTAELTLDGTKCRIPSPTWWIEYTDASGSRDRKPGFADRGATLQLAATLERRAVDVKSGREVASTSGPEHVIDHLPEFRAHLERKGTSHAHLEESVKQVRTVITSLRLTTAAAVDRGAVERWLDGQQRALEWSARTRNKWVGSLSHFGRWLVREKKSKINPFDGLIRQNIATDRRLVRRVLEPDDLNRLVSAARNSHLTFHGLTGLDRAWLYVLAAFTGRRVGALHKMTRADVQLDSKTGLPVAITTGARIQKSKKQHTVPVHPDLARDLAAWLATRPDRGPIFTGWVTWAKRAAELVKHDLAIAREKWVEEAGDDKAELERRRASDRLKYHDAAGEVFDFHALRGQFITSLAIAGVHHTAAQQLADHSDPKLTANVYTRWGNRFAGEVAKLPALTVRMSTESGGE